jgi:hypothetical protein
MEVSGKKGSRCSKRTRIQQAAERQCSQEVTPVVWLLDVSTVSVLRLFGLLPGVGRRVTGEDYPRCDNQWVKDRLSAKVQATSRQIVSVAEGGSEKRPRFYYRFTIWPLFVYRKYMPLYPV